MGRPKALLDWRGQPLIMWQLAQLAGFGQRVVVVGAHAAAIRDARLPDAIVVENPGWEAGRSGSVRLGCRAVNPTARAILIAGVDQPLDADVVSALLGAMDPAIHALAVPCLGGRRGHPILFAGALLPALCELGDGETLRDLAMRYASAAHEVAVESDAILRDLNRPEDLPGG